MGLGLRVMTPFKYVKRGVKRKRQILAGVLPKLEKIARIEGVTKVIPTSISSSPGDVAVDQF
jgi:hypothetical protein